MIIDFIKFIRDEFHRANVGYEDASLTEKFKNFRDRVERGGLSDEHFMDSIILNLQAEYENSILAYTEAGREKLILFAISTYHEDSYIYKYANEHINEIRNRMDEWMQDSKINDLGHKSYIVQQYLAGCCFHKDNGFEEMRQNTTQELYNQHVRTVADMVDEYEKRLEDAGVEEEWGRFATIADNIGEVGIDVKKVGDVSANWRMWKIKDEIRKEAENPQSVGAQGKFTIDDSTGLMTMEF